MKADVVGEAVNLFKAKAAPSSAGQVIECVYECVSERENEIVCMLVWEYEYVIFIPSPLPSPRPRSLLKKQQGVNHASKIAHMQKREACVEEEHASVYSPSTRFENEEAIFRAQQE
jgi:hypothetical protein